MNERLDGKTLADAQPGGRVRLGDQAAWSDSKNPCPYSEQEDGRLRCITAGLDEQIDAAMGASA